MLPALVAMLLACPDCPPSRLARARVMSEGFTAHALTVALPFAVAGAVVAWLGRRVDRDVRGDRTDPEDSEDSDPRAAREDQE